MSVCWVSCAALLLLATCLLTGPASGNTPARRAAYLPEDYAVRLYCWGVIHQPSEQPIQYLLEDYAVWLNYYWLHTSPQSSLPTGGLYGKVTLLPVTHQPTEIQIWDNADRLCSGYDRKFIVKDMTGSFNVQDMTGPQVLDLLRDLEQRLAEILGPRVNGRFKIR